MLPIPEFLLNFQGCFLASYFSERSKVERKEKFPNVAGITPEKLFFAKLIYCIGGDIMEDDGMTPDNSLSERSNITSVVLLKRVEGMFPLSLFCMRSR